MYYKQLKEFVYKYIIFYKYIYWTTPLIYSSIVKKLSLTRNSAKGGCSVRALP